MAGTLAYLGGTEINVNGLYLGQHYAEFNPFTITTSVVTDQLVLRLDCTETTSYPGSGSKWNDISGNGNVASITGSLSFASSSLVFNNNTSNFIQMPHSSTYSVFDGDFTIDHWITVDAFVTIPVNDIIGFYFKGSTNVEANPGFGARMDRDTNAANFGKGFLVANNTSTPIFDYFTNDNASMVARKWYNIQIVRSGSTVKLYSNTVEKQSGSPFSGNFNNTQPLTIGKYNNATYGPWEGKIGTFLIYDKALSTTELTQNYNYYSTKFL
jgi:hypothetical protein